jgi:CHAT domain-containing protein
MREVSTRGQTADDASLLLAAVKAAWRLDLFDETHALAERALEAGQVAAAPANQMTRAALIGAVALGAANRFDEALALFERAGEYANRVDDDACLFEYHINHGKVLTDAGRDAEALTQFRRAERYAGAVSDEFQGALDLNTGAVLSNLGDEEGALAAYRRALPRVGRETRPAVLTNIGNALRGMKRYDEALGSYETALAEAGDDRPRLLGPLLSNLARVLAALGRDTEALAHFERALDIRRRSGDRVGQATTLNQMGRLLFGTKQGERALQAVCEAESILEELGHPDVEESRELRALIEPALAAERSPSTYVAAIIQELLKAPSPQALAAVLGRHPQPLWGSLAEQLAAVEQSPSVSDDLRTAVAVRRAFVAQCARDGIESAMASLDASARERQEHAQLVARLVDEPGWLGKKRLVESKFGLFTGTKIAATFDRLAAAHAERPGIVQALAVHRQLIDRCRADGVDLAFAMFLGKDLEPLVEALIQSGRWGESRVLVGVHQDVLLSAEGLALFDRLAEHTTEPDPLARVKLHRDLLRRCAEVGVDEAFDEIEGSEANVGGQKLVLLSVDLGPQSSDESGKAASNIVQLQRTIDMLDGAVQPLMLAGMKNKLGIAYLDAEDGDPLENARIAARHFADAMALGHREVFPQTYSRCANNMGNALKRIGRLTGSAQDVRGAVEHYRLALDIQRPEFMPSERRRTAENLFYTADELRELLAADADPIALEACTAAMEAVDALAQIGAESAQRDEVESAAWAYWAAAELHMRRSRFGAALEAIERGKARSFLNDVSQAETPVPSIIPADLAARERGARTRLAETRLSNRDGQENRLAIIAARNELDAVYESMAHYAPEYVQYRKAEPPSLESMVRFAADCAPGTVIFEWGVIERSTLLFMLQGGSKDVTAVRLDIGAADIEQFAALSQAEVSHPPDSPDSPIAASLRTVADALFPDAVHELVKEAASLVFVPHRSLHALPLHALPIPWLGDEPLLALKPIEYLPSLAIGQRLIRRRNHGADDAVVLAYGGEAGADAAPFDEEARDVARLLQTTAHVGADAVAATLVAGAGRSRVVHVACHAFHDSSQPMQSGLLLAPGADGQAVFSARHVIEHLTLPGSLVTLSGCETGRSAAGIGDELDGFVRALFAVGASRIVASQWRVDSVSTRTLITGFYEHHVRGLSAQAALRASALALRASPATAHPYYWAPFVTYGV